MSARSPIGKVLVMATLLAFSITACATEGAPPESERTGSIGGPVESGAAAASVTPSPEPSAALSERSCQGTGYFEGLPADASCWIEIPTDDDTLIRVSYTVPAPGWAAFIGTFKDVGDGHDSQRVGVLIPDIKNVTVDACERPVAANPRVGPSVEDLAMALAHLRPFEVSSPAADVTLAGYSGTHMQLRVPLDQPFEDPGGFIGCDNSALTSWIAPPLSFAFYGYAAPGETEDLWILDVEGTRVVISALATTNASEDLLGERQAILDSIVIEP